MGSRRAPEREKVRVSTQNTGAVTQDSRGANNFAAQTEARKGADRPTPGAGRGFRSQVTETPLWAQQSRSPKG